ncbi:cyclin-dependent kinase 2-associated protein 1-like [Oppia nitens]|uniref:cyclin-dependent kinase 2-associated protein 1-like n=1 Tax=Oppia nitens TaxID=1686743 RepID=UPI0023DB9BB2|nr:cyclin-dependent kinase 2-associated protein 1-like [Oppia nitens]
MDLIMDDKPTSSDSPLMLNQMSSQLAQQVLAQQMVSSSVVSSQAQFVAAGVPTLLTPSQMPSLGISPIQPTNSTSKYAQLLQVIEELGKDIRPTYSGSKSSAERLKRGIIHARILVRECLIETERNNSRN